MNIEYISCKVSSLCWLNEEFLRKTNDPTERFWLCGTYGSSENALSIWSNHDTVPGAESQSVSGIYELTNLRYPVSADVVTAANFDKRSTLVSLANGDILWFGHSREKGFEPVHVWSSDDLAAHESSDLLVNGSTEFISSGLDGKLYFFDTLSKKITKSPPLTSNSIHCMDKISPNEVICGTTSGHIKLFDKRSQNVELSLPTDMSSITAIKRNSHIPHIVACGNDTGLLFIWDLRNGGQRPMQPASAHSAMISCLRYVDNEPNILFTSSYDGQLIKWTISNEFVINSVEAIIDKSNTYPINCFDLNQHRQLVFADDNEILYLTSF